MTGTYIEELVFALRLRDVPAERVAVVVAEVEASGAEDPAEVFGPAERYAVQVAAALRQPVATPVDVLRAYPPVLGAMLVVDSLSSLVLGNGGSLTAGEAVVFLLLPPVAVVLIGLATRTGARATARLWAGGAVAGAAIIGALFLGGGVVLVRYPAWVGLVVGLALAAAGGWLLHREASTRGPAGTRAATARRGPARPAGARPHSRRAATGAAAGPSAAANLRPADPRPATPHRHAAAGDAPDRWSSVPGGESGDWSPARGGESPRGPTVQNAEPMRWPPPAQAGESGGWRPSQDAEPPGAWPPVRDAEPPGAWPPVRDAEPPGAWPPVGDAEPPGAWPPVEDAEPPGAWPVPAGGDVPDGADPASPSAPRRRGGRRRQ